MLREELDVGDVEGSIENDDPALGRGAHKREWLLCRRLGAKWHPQPGTLQTIRSSTRGRDRAEHLADCAICAGSKVASTAVTRRRAIGAARGRPTLAPR